MDLDNIVEKQANHIALLLFQSPLKALDENDRDILYQSTLEIFEMGRDSVTPDPEKYPFQELQEKLLVMAEPIFERFAKQQEPPTPEQLAEYELQDFRHDLKRFVPLCMDNKPFDPALQDFRSYCKDIVFDANLLLRTIAEAEPMI